MACSFLVSWAAVRNLKSYVGCDFKCGWWSTGELMFQPVFVCRPASWSASSSNFTVGFLTGQLQKQPSEPGIRIMRLKCVLG